MDSYEYYRYSGKMKDFFLTGTFPGTFFWPKGYPLIVAVFALVLPVSVAGQLVSLLSLYGIYFFSKKVFELFYEEKEDIKSFLLLSLLLAPYLLRNGVLMMSDLLATCCVVATIYHALEFKRKALTSSLVACGFFAFYSVFTRYGTVVPLIPVFFFVVIYLFRTFKTAYVLAFIAPTVLATIHFYFEAEGSEFMGHHFVDEWSFQNYFKRSFSSNLEHQLASLSYPYTNLVYYLGLFFYPGFFLLNLFLFLGSLKSAKSWKTPSMLLVLAVLLVNALFLAGVSFQGDRYLFPSYPVFLVLIFPAFIKLLSRIAKYKNHVVIALAVAQLVLSVRAIYPNFERNNLEKQTVALLEPLQENTLYCFEMDLALQQRGLDFKYENLWFREYETFEKNGLVLFNEAKFTSRFEGKRVMNNWNRIKKKHRLKVLKEIKSGWKLYRIEE